MGFRSVELRMRGFYMKILVTGANGYLGKGVVKVLIEDGISVVATDIKNTYTR